LRRYNLAGVATEILAGSRGKMPAGVREVAVEGKSRAGY
jgi:hypothetical protein